MFYTAIRSEFVTRKIRVPFSAIRNAFSLANEAHVRLTMSEMINAAENVMAEWEMLGHTINLEDAYLREISYVIAHR